MHTSNHNPLKIKRYLGEADDTLALGRALAGCLEPGMLIYLTGDLGTGKTTLVRGVLHGLGYRGKVKSPTFALVELYKLSRLYLYHFDFYRFRSPREMADSGFREYFGRDAVCVVEWPEKAAGMLPPADVRIVMEVAGTGRNAEIEANTEAGRLCLERLNKEG